MVDDTRWKQRLTNFRASVRNLEEALEVARPSKLERQGVIKAFELCYELAWKTLQDYLRELGFHDAVGPKAVIRTAFHEGLVEDGDGWAALHGTRNTSAHLYDESTAATIEQEIRTRHAALLRALLATLESKE